MNVLHALLVVLLVLLIFGAPGWGWHSYGWYPSGGLGLLLLVLLIVLLVR